MCEKQKKLLDDYKETFPRDSFQKISEKTGIQTTRIFRIFKGAPMKLEEFLIFQDLLKTSHQEEIFHLCEKFLTSSELAFLKKQMLFFLEKNQFLRRLS